MTAPGVSRRTVLAGGAALAFLTACGSGDDGGAADTPRRRRARHRRAHRHAARPSPTSRACWSPTASSGCRWPSPTPRGCRSGRASSPGTSRSAPTAASRTVVTVDPPQRRRPHPLLPASASTPAGAGIRRDHRRRRARLQRRHPRHRRRHPHPDPGPAPARSSHADADDPRGVDPICTRTPRRALPHVDLTRRPGGGRRSPLVSAPPSSARPASAGRCSTWSIEAAPDYPDDAVHPRRGVRRPPAATTIPPPAALAPVIDAYGLTLRAGALRGRRHGRRS